MNHVLSRSVRDSAAMLDATHGSEAGSLCRLAPPVRPYLEEVGRDPRRVRIALCGRSPIGTEVDVEAVNALMQAAKLLESAGHDLCEAEPDLDGVQLAKDFVTIWFATCAATVRAIKAQTGCRNTDFELDTQAAAAFGEATSAREYVECYRRCSGYTRALADFHKRFDVYMTPMTSAAAPRIGEIATAPMQQLVIKALLAFRLSGLVLKSGVLDQMVRDNLARIPFAQLSNLTGTPSMSVPLHWTQQGMPLGVQFVADHGSEGLLFSLAGQLERAQPWFDRHPPLAVQPATASSAPAPAACLPCARRPAAG